ncbi:MAG: tRNA (N(6)-L-threonylcarbamoyladenosine(37)-C(2))-methylthiotransferase MtaB [Halodesulfovibrio sp.]
MSDFHTFYMATHGCKINQYETQALREVWTRRGFREVQAAEDASVVLVNSCAVTAKAVSELRSVVRQANRSNPQARIIITGCAAQVMGKELETLPGVVEVVPQEAKASLKHWPHKPEEPAEEVAFPAFSISGYNRARAVVKVQDGCSHRCTYCIVPLTRGRSKSRAIADIVSESRSLLEAGFREIILSGVNLRQFGMDLPYTPDFWDLVATLESSLGPDWAGVARFRLSSLEPGQLDARALETLGTSRLVAPQLHISMQSGSDSVLKRMGRGHYKVTPLLEFLEQLRTVWPVYGLGADILMGFPGETEDEFAQTLDAVKAMPLTYAHVFPYSRRPGTAASAMPGQLDKQTKAARAKAVRDIVTAKKTEFLKWLVQSETPLDVVLQSGQTRGGISQYYTECHFSLLPLGAAQRDIVRGVAVDVRKRALLVRPL